MSNPVRFPEWPLLGAGLALAFGLSWLSTAAGARAPGARPTIVVTRAAVERMRAARVGQSGPAVPPPAVAELVDEVVEEEILWREGRVLLANGGDPAVRRRAEALRREIAAGRTGEDDAGDASGVGGEVAGLARTDLVLRRHLVESARLALARQGAGSPPGEAEIDAWSAREPGRFGRPARLRFEQVFLSRDRRGAAVDADATALLARLASGSSAAAGDPFPVGPSFTGSPAEVDRAFGPDFARRAAALPPGRWAGPVSSPLGVHLVRLDEALPAGQARPESVRSRAALAWHRERSGRLLRERLAALRAGYEIVVEEGVGSPAGERAREAAAAPAGTVGS